MLSRIERELRSIRSDLSALKKELADLRRPGAAAAAAGSAAGPKAKFFEEEEDDTIALTGDELDNILNTADITEESVEAPAAEADLAGLGDDGPLPELGDITADGGPCVRAVPIAEALEELEEVTDLELEPSDGEPAELVLDDIGAAPAGDGELPALDLEGIPEIEDVGDAELEELPGRRCHPRRCGPGDRPRGGRRRPGPESGSAVPRDRPEGARGRDGYGARADPVHG